MTKVTRLQSVPGKTGVAALPRPLEKVRDRYLNLAAGYLSDMLDGADDTLYDLAEKESDSERERYFDAMRELRIQRAGLETGFRQSLSNLFQKLAHSPEKGESLEDTKVDLDSLSLVNEEELETSVALDNMARRARNGCDEQLGVFHHRLEYLFEGKRSFSQRDNPLEPRQLVECFNSCLEKLSLDIKARLIVLKLFERQVMAETGYFASEANKVLIDAGVLPEMKSAPIAPARKAGGRTLAASSESASGGGGPSNDQMFGLLQELLVTMRGMQVGGGHGSAGGAAGPVSPMAVMQDGVPYMNGAPVANAASVHQVSSDDLLGVLNRLQRVERSLDQGDDEDRDLKNHLSDMLDSEHGEAIHALDQADDDVINLVSMLFDFILDDEGLPSEIKALIGRLQIPLLKVAISDKSFFSNDNHEARQLLNMLARAGNQWDPQQGIQDELYQRINQAVHQIIDDYEDDASLFARLLGEFQDYFDSQKVRSERVEQRVREAEEGKARAEQARESVTVLLDQRMAGRSLPDVVVRLLRQGWQQVLYLTWLREGEDSPQWQQQVKVVDAVVWSVLEHREQTALEKLKVLSPKLLKTLHAGLTRINYDSAETNQLLSRLKEVHTQLLKGLQTERVAVKAEQPEAPAPVDPALSQDHFLVRKVSQLSPGQWIEIGEGEDAVRAKLAANIRSGTKLVFTNRRGIKVQEYTGYDLAVALHKGAVKLIEEGALFDRALEAVIGDLRRRQGVA
ncbi:hypothetical protein A11A3_09600 [Alcanivorax hongdengensis A-11-3]|uniref:Thymidine phosphorylase n=1 Tax=Alcanivorax hongdengensis A-11-3 TaxID=1177179 RepID=L0WB58_9GAMM|nr:DUF1631 domain-containing protein [Alcanivorax hongdengensis]EKF74244.1 hypothetical protein A11A3_09600 [Alcanivorax hongdengensis A-11-3]